MPHATHNPATPAAPLGDTQRFPLTFLAEFQEDPSPRYGSTDAPATGLGSGGPELLGFNNFFFLTDRF